MTEPLNLSFASAQWKVLMRTDNVVSALTLQYKYAVLSSQRSGTLTSKKGRSGQVYEEFLDILISLQLLFCLRVSCTLQSQT